MASAGRILIMPKGNYDPTKTYEMLDLVFHSGASWVAKRTVTGIAPTEGDDENWQKIAESGVAIETSETSIVIEKGKSVSYTLTKPSKAGYTIIGTIHQLGVENYAMGNATLYQKTDTGGEIYADFDGEVRVKGTFIFTINGV